MSERGFVCRLCARRCGAARSRSEGGGACGCGSLAYVARAAAHFGEEPCISGVHGSGTVFFSGCPLSCVFCQNAKISRAPFYGKALDAAGLREVFLRLADSGVHNINLVSPTQYANVISYALEKPLPVPVVWNSNGYERAETLRMLEGKVQIYLPDVKYSDDALALRLSGAPRYFEAARESVAEMYRQTGPCVLDGEGMLQGGVIVRHLALPSHLGNSRGVIDWFAQSYADKGTLFSLMTQYTPENDLASYPDIARTLSRREVKLLEDYLFTSGITGGFTQERRSATDEMVPDFDLTGL